MTRNNLTVIKQINQREFYMTTADREMFHTVFCEDVPFKPGNVIKLLKYEDRLYCWSVKDKKMGYLIAQGEQDERTEAGTNANSYAYSNPFAYSHTAR